MTIEKQSQPRPEVSHPSDPRCQYGSGRFKVALEVDGLIVDTSAYYAKIDMALLRQIAQPWPEVLR